MSSHKNTISTHSKNHVEPLSSDNNRRKADGSSSSSAANVTYEDLVGNADIFWEKFYALLGVTKETLKKRLPILGGRVVDMHRLFIEITARGGYEKVIQGREWKGVSISLNYRSTVTNASTALKKTYHNYLYQMEQEYYVPKPDEANEAPTPMEDEVAIPEEDEAAIPEEDEAAIPEEDEAAIPEEDEAAIPEEDEVAIPEEGIDEMPVVGGTVKGVVDGKFEKGYLVTVYVGSQEMSGMIYHVPEGPEPTMETPQPPPARQAPPSPPGLPARQAPSAPPAPPARPAFPSFPTFTGIPPPPSISPTPTLSFPPAFPVRQPSPALAASSPQRRSYKKKGKVDGQMIKAIGNRGRNLPEAEKQDQGFQDSALEAGAAEMSEYKSALDSEAASGSAPQED